MVRLESDAEEPRGSDRDGHARQQRASGEDIVKSLALGSSFVFCGRPMIYGAAAAGPAGIAKAFELLVAEMTSTMVQIGRATNAELPGVSVAAGDPLPVEPAAAHKD